MTFYLEILALDTLLRTKDPPHGYIIPIHCYSLISSRMNFFPSCPQMPPPLSSGQSRTGCGIYFSCPWTPSCGPGPQTWCSQRVRTSTGPLARVGIYLVFLLWSHFWLELPLEGLSSLSTWSLLPPCQLFSWWTLVIWLRWCLTDAIPIKLPLSSCSELQCPMGRLLYTKEKY
jgi:hypothetical protein